MGTIGTAEIAKLLQIFDKNLTDLDDATKKKYKSSIKKNRTEIEDMVENVTTVKEYQDAAKSLAAKIAEVQRFAKLQEKKAGSGPDYPAAKVAKIDGLKTGKAKTKIASVWELGPDHRGTPGPKSMGTLMLHTHITNRDAIAYYWKKDQMHVEGYGEKSNQAGSNDSGYKWETK